MAILNAPTTHQNASPPNPQPVDKSPLFVRTIIPKGAISRTISCSLLPPHALSRATAAASRKSPPALKSCRQVVVSTDTSLQVLAVDDQTLSLRPLTDVMLFTSIYDIAAVSTPVLGRDVLVVLSASAKISFMQFDDSASRLRCSGQVSLVPPNSPHMDASLRSHPRLLATHPRKRMVAFAPLQSRISVFPVLFLSKRVNAGKIASVSVDGVVLSLDFLEDDEGVPGDAILLALLQRGKHQVISLYTVGVPPDSGGGLSVSFVGSMITCASHPDDVAVARATSKLTGQSVRPTPPAVAVTRLPGCPFLFAVFVHGKIIAGDARSVIVNAHSGDAMPRSVRIEDDVILPTRSTRLDDFSPVPVPVPVLDDLPPRSISPEHLDPATSTPETPVASSATQNEQGAPGSSATASDPGPSAASGNDGFVTPIQTPVIRTEPPSAPLQRRPRRIGRVDIPPLQPLSRRTSNLASGYNGERNPGEDYLSYLFIPAYITLDVGDANGVATAWVDARDHFRDESGDGNGLYFVMESGAMYALKWSDSVKAGATTFRIPGGERTRTSPKRNFCVEYIGDVGPAVSIASLDRRLIFIANDGADGSLRRLHLPHTVPSDKDVDNRTLTFKRRLSGRGDGGRYGLEVRQEFLNLAPISDFVIVPPREKETIHSNLKSIRSGEQENKTNSSSSDMVLQRYEEEKRTALEHVLEGGSSEAEMVICSGIGRYGCVRIVRPGAPVSIFASTDGCFPACNNMWSLRFTLDSLYDAGIVLSFTQATRLLLATPPSPDVMEKIAKGETPPVIANLVDGTRSTGLLSNTRSIHVGTLEDGVVVQIHEGGIRLVFLKKAGDMNLSESVFFGELMESISERTVDWSPPDGGFISMGTVGAGFVLICVIRHGVQKSMLYLLKCYRGNPSTGLCVVSSTEIDSEVSCIEIPEWTTVYSESDISPRLPPMAIVGTYAPSVDVRLLGPTMEVVASRTTYPWSVVTSPEVASKGKSAYDELSSSMGKSTSRNESGSVGYQPSAKSDLMTAVPESMCAVEIEGRRNIFVGLRDGSVVCLTLNEGDVSDMNDSGSPNSGATLIMSSHRKLGDRPVALKSVNSAIGRVVLGQAERPWMCSCLGGGRLKWTPLAFTETQALCSFSVPGAERCFAAVGDDDTFYICGLRRQTDVSVRSIHVGSTPRRVISVRQPEDAVVVATSCDPISQTESDVEETEQQLMYGNDVVALAPKQPELRLYNRKERELVTSTGLLRGELVHVLLNWLQYIVVGTSLGLRSYEDADAQRSGKRGRLLLYMLRKNERGAGSSEDIPSSPTFELCCEVVLPGAVLAGDVNEDDGLLVVSCNQEVLVFAVAKPRNVLVEIARVSSATLVVGLSFKEDMVCVVDRKASVSLFHLKKRRCRLVRDRSDHRRRIMSDAALVDRSLAIGVDRSGGLLTIGYADGDEPPAMAEASVHYPPILSMGANGESEGSAACPGDGSHENMGMLSGPINLGEEFDVIHLESESENTADSNDPPVALEAAMATEPATQDTNEVVEDAEVAAEDSDPMLIDDSAQAEDDDVAELVDEGDADFVVENEDQDMNLGENNEAVIAEGMEPNMDVIIDGEEADVGEVVEEPESEQRTNRTPLRIPRNLKCHHCYNMQDSALRIQLGTFSRACRAIEMNGWGDGEARDLAGGERFFSTWSCAAFCGTLGGAVISAVGMSREAYALLSAVETEMSMHPEIAGPGLGSSHKHFRKAYGQSATGVVDGDLLSQFDGLRHWVKREIARRMGFDGEHGVLYIEGLIRDLCDRVG